MNQLLQGLYKPLEDGALEGMRAVKRNLDEKKMTAAEKRWSIKVDAATELLNDIKKGRAPYYFLREALLPSNIHAARNIARNYRPIFNESMTTSDFPQLTGDVLDRMALANFMMFPSLWRSICKVSTLRDFRQVKRIAANGLEGTWPVIPEKAEVKDKSMSEENYTYTPQKYGCSASISWEAILNDDLDQFSSIPARLGRGGARTIAKFVSELYSYNTSSFFSAANGNEVTGNPVLSIAGLQDAFTTLWQQTDSGGDPIFVEGVKLVYAPANHVIVQNILNSMVIDSTTDGGDSSRRIRVNNWLTAQIEPVMDPYQSIVDPVQGDSAWYLFADPAVSRPALEVGLLSGFDTPQLFQKGGDSVRIGAGGSGNANLGDFATMCLRWKGVMAFGGTTLEKKSAVASKGDLS